MSRTRMELHTHLMGMLSAKAFVKFLIANEVYSIYWPINKPYDENSKIISLKEILCDDDMLLDLLSQLQIEHSKNVDYRQLNNYYKNRRDLIKFVVESQKDYKDSPSLVKKRIYNNYINECLRELVCQGVKYVEISYSIRQVLLNFEIANDVKGKIECKFLLSTDRSNPISKFKESSKDLKKVLDNGIAVGFDIMGEEREFSLEELDEKSDKCFKMKLLNILVNLYGKDGATLRLHSGETNKSVKNTEITLSMLEEIKNQFLSENPNSKEEILPPPEIRIGHGLYFEENENYLRLLKKFKCIVEINASSNYALGNIGGYNEIPYKYYIQNGIPLVISTDGHGLYDTTIQLENEIAKKFLGPDLYNKLVMCDTKILMTKLRGGK